MDRPGFRLSLATLRSAGMRRSHRCQPCNCNAAHPVCIVRAPRCAGPGHQPWARNISAPVSRASKTLRCSPGARASSTTSSLPGTLEACFVRSPHPHARIRAIDTSAARAMPGVHAVLTADDLPPRMATGQIPMLVPNPAIKTPRTQLALARNEVCYVGQTVAVVIADDRYLAEDAAAAVAVDYDVLPSVSDCRDAVKPDAPRAHSDLAGNIAAFVPMSYGDVDAAFANAPHVFEDELLLHRGAAMTLEGRAVLASHDADADLLTVWSATQTPHLARGTLADMFERDLEFDPRDRAGGRRRLRHQGAVLCGRSGDPGGGDEARPAGEMAGGPPRALPELDAGARPGLAGRHRGRPRRQDPRAARQDVARHRRLCAVGHHRALHRGDDVSRPLRGAGLQDRSHRRPHQPRADHRGARRRPAAGGVRHGAADGPRGA